MGLGPDASYNGQSKIYRKQQPEGATLNGAAVITEEVLDAGSLLSHYGQESYGGVVEPANVTFGIAQGATSNLCVVTIQVNDGAGNPIANLPADLDVILSDAASGVGVTATSPSGGVAVTTGTQLQVYTAAKALYAQCNASGIIAITITDTAKTGFYVAVIGLPVPFVSRQLVAGDYK
jgi:hypothetical protein